MSCQIHGQKMMVDGFCTRCVAENTIRFSMIIEEAIPVKGRGMAVTGWIEKGEIRVGDEINQPSITTEDLFKITGIEQSGKPVRNASAGNRATLLIRDAIEEDFEDEEFVTIIGLLRE